MGEMDLKAVRERDLKDLGIAHFGDRRAMYKQIQKLIESKTNIFGTGKYGASGQRGIWRMISIGDDEPDEFCCPISYEIFVDPVIVTVSGQTYERKAIEDYIRTEHQDPIT